MAEMKRGEAAMHQYDVLVDADALVGAFFEKDAHYQRSTEGFKKLTEQRDMMVVTDYTIAETVTVLSKHTNQENARRFLAFIEMGDLPVIHMNEDLVSASFDIFKAQPGRRISLFDCANVAVMQRFNIPRIFAYDQFYFKKIGLTPAI
jgi:predicted nucleic acid-binding protein